MDIKEDIERSDSYLAYKKSHYKSIKHSTYFDAYDDLFSSHRNKEITFVEIGVLGGGSLFMWREFFGPKARIIGIDLNPNAKKWEEHGFEIFIGNQSDISFWNNFTKDVGQIDIVLDDGGHTYDQQIITTEMLIDHINDGGMIVVEDTHTSYMDGFGPQKYSFINYTKRLIDLINGRFGEFKDCNTDKRIWSLRYYESIVAFIVNRKASHLESEPTNNSGESDSASDFRYNDNKLILRLQDIVDKFRGLKMLPGFNFFGKLIRGFIVNRNFKSRNFFRDR